MGRGGRGLQHPGQRLSMARRYRALFSLAVLGCSLQAMAMGVDLAAEPAGAAPVETVSLCFERANVTPWRTEQQGGLNFELLRMVEQRLNIRFDFHSLSLIHI